jgi:hypothetical protein
MPVSLQDRLTDGSRVHLVTDAQIIDLTSLVTDLLALLAPARELARYSQAGRRGAHERIVATETLNALQEALEQTTLALDALDFE